MKQRLRNELSFLALMALPLFLRRDRARAAIGVVGLAAAIRYFPLGARYSFRDKHILITSGSRGLGFALAREFLREGACVSLLARDGEELKEAKRLLQAEVRNARVRTFVCDVTDKAQLREAIGQADFQNGTIDVVVNNAGAIMAAPFALLNADDFRAQMDLHLNAVVEMTHQMSSYFKKTGQGRIVNISSIGGKIALPHMSTYTASKFALSGFSRAIAAELAPHNITVTTVYPGLMRTGSTIQAVFKGDQEKEFALFSAMDLMPGFSMEASEAARKILEACREGDVEAVLSWSAKLGAFAFENFPEVTGLVFKLAAGFLPVGESLERRTGAESQGLFKSMPWTKPLRDLDQDARRDLNQIVKKNGDFNLGVTRNDI